MADPEFNSDFEALLSYLKHSQGCDLTSYKRSSLMRRFDYRMQSLQIDRYPAYLQYLQDHPDEYLALVDTVLINVTDFFRDRDAWDCLNTEVIPKILASKEPDEPIRVWSAGCAAGQEVYSLLMLLAEALGIETCIKRVQCFATDVDVSALQQARNATYSPTEVANIPADLLAKYFHSSGSDYVFHPQLRHTLVFGRQDLTQDSPISKIDILLCRNVLIYLQPETQASILIRFHFALKPTGFLFLGKAETIATPRRIFTSINWKQKIYTKSLNLGLEEVLSLTSKAKKKRSLGVADLLPYYWKTAFETNPLAQLVVNDKGYVISANQPAIDLFQLTLKDYDRPFAELEPAKLIGPYAFLPAFHHHHAVTFKKIEWHRGKETKFLNAQVSPVFNTYYELLGLALTFQDITETHQLQEELASTKNKLSQVSHALQITTDALNNIPADLDLLNAGFLDADWGDRLP